MSGMTITLGNQLSPQDVNVIMAALACWEGATSCDIEAVQRRDQTATIRTKLLLTKLAFVPVDQSRKECNLFAEAGVETGNG